MGALAQQATHDSRAINEKARRVYRDSFMLGHCCAICRPITLPADLDDVERARRADALRRLHFSRMALASSRHRKKKAPEASW